MERAIQIQPNGTVTFVPEYSKEQAGYVAPGRRDFDTTHDRCETCTHYIQGGACHLVEGSILHTAYCEEFYADYTVSAHDHGPPEGIEVNHEEYGGDFDFSEDAVTDFLGNVRERMQAYIRRR